MPHPSGIIGFRPGIATISLTLGGSIVGGDSNALMNDNITTKVTANRARLHNQSETSPYALQNLRGLEIFSKIFNPCFPLIIKMTLKTLEEFHRSKIPLFSHDRRMIAQMIIVTHTNVQSASITMKSPTSIDLPNPLPPSMLTPNLLNNSLITNPKTRESSCALGLSTK